jgi:predicted MPP superfamily phosphohydrolase
LPQWFIFTSIVVIAYGWVERKKTFRIIGLSILILLGAFAFYSIYTGSFFANEFLTPDEMMTEELDGELIEEIPFQAKLLPAYWTFVVSAILAFPAIYFDWKNKKPNRLFIILAGLIALLGFFIIVGELRML